MTLSILALFCFLLLNAQNKLQETTYRAFLQQDLALWEQAIETEKKAIKSNNEKEQLQLLHLYYGYTAQLLASKQEQKAMASILAAEKIIDSILSKNPKQAEALNYKAVFISYRIPFNKLKAPILGRESVSLLNQALSLAPKNPQILFDKGNSLYYVPKIFGGNKKEALVLFQKAIAMLEKEGKTDKNWIYLQLIFLEAHCFELLGETNKAKVSYRKVIEKEPKFKIAQHYYAQLLAKEK